MVFLKKNKSMFRGVKGLTLMELLIAFVILVFTSTSVAIVYFNCLELNELSHNKRSTMLAAKSRMELIRNTTFSDLISSYHNTKFLDAGVDDLASADVSAVSYVVQEGANIKLYRIVVTVCWRQKNGRIIGEDTNLNGVLDIGEDVSGGLTSVSGFLDSPVTLVSYIYDI